MGGSDDGEGNGANAYRVIGMADGPGSVSTLILVIVRTEEGVDALLLPEKDKLAALGVGVKEGGNDGRRVDGECDKIVVDGKEECKGEDKDKWVSEGAAAARAATKRTRTAEDHINLQWGNPVD